MRGKPGLTVLTAAALGCTAVQVRPHYGPLPGATSDTLTGRPATVIAALARRLGDAGLRVARQSAAEGYLETDWFDLVSRRSVGPDHLETGHVVRLRAWADSVPPTRTLVRLEAVYRRTVDPSAPGREEEIVAPPGHPGDSLAHWLLGGLGGRGRSP